MNGEMTITQHNERLILEKNALIESHRQDLDRLGLIIGGIMRQMKRRTINLKPNHIVPPGVHLDFQEDGGVKITFNQPNPNGMVKDEQSTDSPS